MHIGTRSDCLKNPIQKPYSCIEDLWIDFIEKIKLTDNGILFQAV